MKILRSAAGTITVFIQQEVPPVQHTLAFHVQVSDTAHKITLVEVSSLAWNRVIISTLNTIKDTYY